MKFLVPLALLTVITVGSALPLWLPLSTTTQHLATPAPQPVARFTSVTAPPATSQLLRFEASVIAPIIPSLLTDVYFYEGQYVRRGQVLAKLKTRPANVVAYLTAPHDGVLSRARVSVGELLSPQMPLTILTDQTRLHVRHANHHFHAGDSVRVSLMNSAATPMRGKVTAATPTELTVQLRRAVAGAAVGAGLTLTANENFVQERTTRADKAVGPAPGLRYSEALAWE